MRNQLPYICIALLMGVLNSPAVADDLSRREALKAIQEMAGSICSSIPLDASSRSVDLSGDAKAKLTGVLSKVADLGIEGAAKYQNNESRGILQTELAAAIKNSDNCKLQVFTTLSDKLLTPVSAAPVYSTTCKFTQGPRAGSQFHFQPGTVVPAIVGYPCQDGMGSFGIAVKD